MKNSALILRGVALACAIGVASLPALAQDQSTTTSPAKHAAKKGDPARWTTGDSTKAQRKATLKKEINAAYAEQQGACKRESSGQRATCLKEARQTYQHDLAQVPQLLADAPAGGVTERVVSTTTGAPDTPAQGGASAYGNSAAGSMGSGSMGSSGGGMTGSGTGNSSGNVDAVPPNNGQAGGMPPPIDQPNPVQPVQPQQGDTGTSSGIQPAQQQ